MDSNFQQTEQLPLIQREQSSFESLLLDWVTAYVDGTVGNALTAAEETIAGIWARALGSAVITPANPLTRLVTTEVMQSIGRSFILDGESLWTLDIPGMRLMQASHWDVQGDTVDPAAWTYRLDIQVPSAQISRYETAAGVLHFRHAPRPTEPWRGISPLAASETTRQLLRQLEAKLSEEVATTTGQIIPVPSTQATQTAGLQAQLRELKGKIVLVPSTSSGWGEGRQAAPPRDWQKTRLGADPPQSLLNLRAMLTTSLAAAAGIPAALVVSESSEAGRRESWRQFLHGTIAQIGTVIQEELQAKLDPNIRIDFEKLFASDVQGRARAYGSLIQAGMEPAMAAHFTGFSDGESRDTAPGRVRLPSADPG